jgi:hypothetical protein
MPGGSSPGERRGGRQKGTPNKATAELKEYAGQFTKQAVDALVRIMAKGKSEQARVAAANALLDRAVGKPAQAITGEDGAAMVARFIIETHDGPPPTS